VREITESLRNLLVEGVPVVIYNAPYDLSLLHHEAIRYGVEPLRDPLPIIDPLVIDKECDRYRKGKRTLELTSAHYHVALQDAHDAASDAIAAARVAQAIARTFPDVLDLTAEELHNQQI